MEDGDGHSLRGQGSHSPLRGAGGDDIRSVNQKKRIGNEWEIEENRWRIENKGLVMAGFVPGKQKRNKQARMEKW